MRPASFSKNQSFILQVLERAPVAAPLRHTPERSQLRQAAPAGSPQRGVRGVSEHQEQVGKAPPNQAEHHDVRQEVGLVEVLVPNT